MTQLLLAKEGLKNFIGKYEVYLKPLGKFLLALAALVMINRSTGYMTKIDSFSVVMVVALMCSFMPVNFIIVCAGLFILMHFYALSLECALIAVILFLLLALLYFRFASKDTLVVLLLPMFFFLKIPYVIPICMGLLATPASVVSVACGVIVYYVIHYVTQNAQALMALKTEELSTRFRYVVDGLLNNKTMIVVIAAFAFTLIVVYLVRRMAIDHSWTIAIIAGVMVQMLALLLGNLVMDTDIGIVGIIFGNIIAAGIAKIVEFLTFHLDYSRTENVQFEDDDYYYYVKAVPKINVSKTSRTVKRINTQKKKRKA